MKRIIATILIALLLLNGATALAESYRVASRNEKRFAALLTDLVKAYEAPSAGDGEVIDAHLAAIRAERASDGEIADAIASHWRAVYLDENYRLYLHPGTERAEALEQAGYVDSATHAFVVLGYELKNGEMTEELKGRSEAAAAAARSFPSAILVCSGGATGDNNPKKHTEAGMMKAYLVKQCGIDASRIETDERAMTTVENALNTFKILRKKGIRTMTIVTSSYHQRWGQAIYNAVAAIYRQKTGYFPKIIANYCYDIEPSVEAYRNDDRIAARQIASVLKLPKDAVG